MAPKRATRPTRKAAESTTTTRSVVQKQSKPRSAAKRKAAPKKASAAANARKRASPRKATTPQATPPANDQVEIVDCVDVIPPAPPAAQPRNPFSYVVSWRLSFEDTEIGVSTEIGGLDCAEVEGGETFDAHGFRQNCERLAKTEADKSGLQTHLWKTKTEMTPPGKGSKMGLDWSTLGSVQWDRQILPMIEIYKTSKSQAKLRIDIAIVYARSASWTPELAASSQAGSKRTPTNNMLAKVAEQKLSSKDSKGIIPLLERWRCKDNACAANRGQHTSVCYILNKTHYRVPMFAIKRWAEQIIIGEASIEALPANLLAQVGPAGRVAPTPKKAEREEGQRAQSTWGQGQLTYPFPLYPPSPYQGYTIQQPVLQQPEPAAAGSSPPRPVFEDLDEEVEAFFEWLIARYPRQRENLQISYDSAHGEGVSLEYLWEWSKAKPMVVNEKLVMGDGLRRRIHTDIKTFQTQRRADQIAVAEMQMEEPEEEQYPDEEYPEEPSETEQEL